MPHPSHGPHSSTPTLGQSLDCNLPLPLKLAAGEEFRASRLPTFITGCCFPFLNSLVARHHPTLAVARSHQMRLVEPGLPHLALGHTRSPATSLGRELQVLSPAATISPRAWSSGLEVNRAVTGRLRPANAQGPWWLFPEKGLAEVLSAHGSELVPFP